MEIGGQAGIVGTEPEQTIVAKDDVAGSGAQIGLGQDAGGQFRADAGGVAHRDRDHRQGSVRLDIHLVLPGRAQPAAWHLASMPLAIKSSMLYAA